MIGMSPPAAAALEAFRNATAQFDALCEAAPTDAQVAPLSHAISACERDLAALPATNLHDLAAKVHLLLEHKADICGHPAPIPYKREDETAGEILIETLCQDLARLCPTLYGLPHPDAALLEAGRHWSDAGREIYGNDGNREWFSSAAAHSANTRNTTAFAAALANTASTADGAIVKLLAAIELSDGDREVSALIASGDFDGLVAGIERWDASTILILMAIGALIGRPVPAPARWVARAATEESIIRAFDPEAVPA